MLQVFATTMMVPITLAGFHRCDVASSSELVDTSGNPILTQ